MHNTKGFDRGYATYKSSKNENYLTFNHKLLTLTGTKESGAGGQEEHLPVRFFGKLVNPVSIRG